MKHLRKAALLAAVSACMLYVLPAQAEEPQTDVSLTIQNNSVTEHTFELYQIFTGTVNNDVLENIEWGTGITEEFKEAHPNAAGMAVTLNDENDASAFAGTLISEHALMEPDETMIVTVPAKGEATVTATPGYYLIKDQDGSQNMPDSAYTKHILHLTSNLVISSKISIPTVELNVADINDTQQDVKADPAEIEEADWGTSADYDKNDLIPFRVIATLPSNYDDYEKYSYDVTIETSKGLTLQEDLKAVRICADGSAVDISDVFVKTDGEDGSWITVSSANLKECTSLIVGDQICIYGSALLNDDAVTNTIGNALHATVTYTNDPNTAEGTADTTPATAKVFTYNLTVHKYGDHKGDAYKLPGASFTLYKELRGGKIAKIMTSKVDEKNPDTVFSGLDDGTYILEETKAPSGYNTMDSSVEYGGKTYTGAMELTIEAQHDTEGTSPSLISTSLNGETTGTPGVFTVDVVDRSGKIMPMTGGRGTKMITLAGAAMIILGILGMQIGKRK